jgi:hypothetical protein
MERKAGSLPRSRPFPALSARAATVRKRENVLDALALMLSPAPGEKRERELLHLKVA